MNVQSPPPLGRLLVGLIVVGVLLGGQASSAPRTLSQVAHVDPGGGFNADVFTHGKFAYLASWGLNVNTPAVCPSRGVRVYDLQDPRQPALVATFADALSEPALAGTWTEKVIVRRVRTPSFKGDLAVTSVQHCLDGAFRGFALYDVTDPSSPRRLALYATEPETGGSHEIWLARKGRHAYVYTAIPFSELETSADGTMPGRPDFRIIDVSDPRNPTVVGEWGAWQELGLRPDQGLGADPIRLVHSVITDPRATRAYLSYWDLGTVILDISEPTNPTYLGRTPYASDAEGNAHSAALDRRRKLLIETDEDFSLASGAGEEVGWGYARIFDVSKVGAPVQRGAVKLPSTTQVPAPRAGVLSVHDPKLRGNRVYFSWYAEGVVVVDISDPANPALIAQFVPPTNPAVWGVFLTRQFVLASDINNGLYVLRLE